MEVLSIVLSIEEKAKRYDEVLRRAKNTIEVNQTIPDIVECIESLFPELKESEDEKIRKQLLQIAKESEDAFYMPMTPYTRKRIIEFLEKQGKKETLCDKCRKKHPSHSCQDITELGRCTVEHEQEHTDKVETKFHVGDWVVNNGSCCVYQITSIRGDEYCLWPLDSEIEGFLRIVDVHNNYHLWTIQDAKDGDVIVCPKYAGDIIQNIFIFKNIKRKDNDVYCHCSFSNTFRTEGYIASADPIDTDFYPATKEQRNILFKAMADAGYTFDFEKKELKIEQKTAELSERDKEMLNNIIDYIKPMPIFFDSTKGKSGKEYTREFIKEAINWLQSLKDRIQPQNTWKHSDEQIKVCKEVYADLLSAKGFNVGTINSELNRLEEQLKKLKE